MATDHSPRSAAVLLSRALVHLHVVQPPQLREPVADILRAGVELCTVSRSLLGLPIHYTLDLAQAVIDAADS